MTNIVNSLVLDIQKSEVDSVKYNLAYADLFEIVMRETIEPKVESFSRQLRGDVAEGVSKGYELLMELVNTWDGTGNFHTWFKTSMDNQLIDLVRTLGRDVRSHNTSYAVSLSSTSEMDEGDSSPMMEILNDESLITTFDITEDEHAMETIISGFRKRNAGQADLIEYMMTFPNDFRKSDETRAIAEYYGVQKYTPAIQKRVSRARNSFKKFVKAFYQKGGAKL